jgi:uncharacterized membrane protein SirB2
MKIDNTKTIIAFNLSGVSLLCIYKFSNVLNIKLLSIITFVFLFIPLFFALAYKSKQKDKTKKIRNISYFFVAIIVICNVIFTIFAFGK